MLEPISFSSFIVSVVANVPITLFNYIIEKDSEK